MIADAPAEACEAALRAAVAARAGMAHLDAVRHVQRLPPLPFGGAASRRDTVGQYRRGRSSGLHRHRSRSQPGQPAGRVVPAARPIGAGLGRRRRQSPRRWCRWANTCCAAIAAPCAVFTLPDARAACRRKYIDVGPEWTCRTGRFEIVAPGPTQPPRLRAVQCIWRHGSSTVPQAVRSPLAVPLHQSKRKLRCHSEA